MTCVNRRADAAVCDRDGRINSPRFTAGATRKPTHHADHVVTAVARNRPRFASGPVKRSLVGLVMAISA